MVSGSKGHDLMWVKGKTCLLDDRVHGDSCRPYTCPKGDVPFLASTIGHRHRMPLNRLHLGIQNQVNVIPAHMCA